MLGFLTFFICLLFFFKQEMNFILGLLQERGDIYLDIKAQKN